MPWIERCRSCNRPVSIEEQGPEEAAAKMRAEIECPHCNDVWESLGGTGAFTTSALTPEQEQAFHKGELKPDR